MVAKGKKLLKVKRRAQFKHQPMSIHHDDQVQVMSGNDRGKVGKVLTIRCARQEIVVEGVNKRFKHVKKTQQNPQGGRVESEASIALSNVLLYCDGCGRGRRHRVEVSEDSKARVCSKCGSKKG